MTNIQSTNDNECFKWCLVRYLNPADRNRARITKNDQDFAKKLDFKDKRLPVKTRDIPKIEKKNSIDISVFGYENKVKYSIYAYTRCCEEKHVDLLLIGEGDKKHNLLIKNVNIFMYDHTLPRRRKQFLLLLFAIF